MSWFSKDDYMIALLFDCELSGYGEVQMYCLFGLSINLGEMYLNDAQNLAADK